MKKAMANKIYLNDFLETMTKSWKWTHSNQLTPKRLPSSSFQSRRTKKEGISKLLVGIMIWKHNWKLHKTVINKTLAQSTWTWAWLPRKCIRNRNIESRSNGNRPKLLERNCYLNYKFLSFVLLLNNMRDPRSGKSVSS